MSPLNLPRIKIHQLLVIAFIIIGVCPAFTLNSPADAYIDLQNQRLTITPKEFYVARIDDERTNKTNIGKLQPPANTPKTTELIKVDLQGGAIAAIRDFVSNSFAANKVLRPIIVKLKIFNVEETTLPSGRVGGKVAIAISFGFERDDDFILLDTYTAGSTYQRNAGPPQQIEPLLRAAIVNSLLYMNSWIDRQAGTNMKLAKGVAISFTNYKEEPEGDTLYYDVNRPLKWADFVAKPPSSRYAAEIFASLGYEEDVKLINGVINIKLNIKVYVPKSASWVRYDGVNNNSLSHEQRHFDIVKLFAERFKQKILAEKLNTYNYDGPINVAYLEILREIYDMQKLYDSETGHGTNGYQQQQWNNKIDSELQQWGIKPPNG